MKTPKRSLALRPCIIAVLLLAPSSLESLACGGSAPFQVFSGNAVRSVEDMAFIPGHNAAPRWGRFHNTIPRRRDFWFGTGGCWRHYWQYDLIINDHGAELIYPSGVRRSFQYQEDGTWKAREGATETLVMEGDVFMVTASDSSKLRFIKAQDTGVLLTHRLVSMTTARGAVTTLNYDASGKLLAICNATGGKLSIDYTEIDEKTAISKVTNSDGRMASYDYETKSGGSHLVLSGVRYSDSTKAYYTYKFIYPGKPPMLETADDPRCTGIIKRIKYAYQKSPRVGEVYQEINPDTETAYSTLEFHRRYRNLRTVRYAGGRSIIYETPLEANGRITRMVDSLGRETRMENVKRVAGKGISKQSQNHPPFFKPAPNTKRTLNERGQTVQAVNSDGGILEYVYDNYGRLLSEKDAQGNRMEYTHDNFGRIKTQKDNSGGITKFTYAGIPDGCRNCAIGLNPTRIQHPDGRVDEITYDTEGRLLTKKLDAGTATAAVTTYDYDELDNITRVTLPDGTIVQNPTDAILSSM